MAARSARAASNASRAPAEYECPCQRARLTACIPRARRRRVRKGRRYGPAKRGATNDVPRSHAAAMNRAATRAEDWFAPRGRGAIARGRGRAYAFAGGGRGAYAAAAGLGAYAGRGAYAAAVGRGAVQDAASTPARHVPGGVYSLMWKGRDRTPDAAAPSRPAAELRGGGLRDEGPQAQRRERRRDDSRPELYEQGSGMADTLLLDFLSWTCATLTQRTRRQHAACDATRTPRATLLPLSRIPHPSPRLQVHVLARVPVRSGRSWLQHDDPRVGGVRRPCGGEPSLRRSAA